MPRDILLRRGLFFDGTGAAPGVRDVRIRDGRVAEVSVTPLAAGDAQVIDAEGQWVMPGFVDIHTHYDAELIAAPKLGESLRHGVTTVTVGSCSISAVLSEPEDCSDLFTRVEAVPRSHVLPLLQQKKRWTSAAGYVDFLDRHPLGPNVTTFLGHSDLRVRVLGLDRAVDPEDRPSEQELRTMERHLHEALDAGFLGLSSMTTPWDKLDGDRQRSKSLPSTYATWSEYRRLNRALRARDRILQSAPNVTNPANALLFFLQSMARPGRKKLKTTLITLLDAKAMPHAHRVNAAFTKLVNRLGADLRWQTLPVPFEIYADGIELVVFEEFGAGREILHQTSHDARRELMNQPRMRDRFKRAYEKRFSPRVWNRNLDEAFIVACPDEPAIVGQSFGAVARARGAGHPVDTFLDLVSKYGDRIRWRMTVANHRPDEVAHNISHPATLLGFADSGAHIRNMAFYSFPLRMLRFVRDRERDGRPVMSVARAVHRLTGELGEWLGIDVGHLRIGDHADVVVVDPEALDARLDAYHEAPMEGFPDLVRMVNRSDGAVRAVVVNGKVAFRDGAFEDAVGRETGFGRFVRAGGVGIRPRTPATRVIAESRSEATI